MTSGPASASTVTSKVARNSTVGKQLKPRRSEARVPATKGLPIPAKNSIDSESKSNHAIKKTTPISTKSLEDSFASLLKTRDSISTPRAQPGEAEERNDIVNERSSKRESDERESVVDNKSAVLEEQSLICNVVDIPSRQLVEEELVDINKTVSPLANKLRREEMDADMEQEEEVVNLDENGLNSQSPPGALETIMAQTKASSNDVDEYAEMASKETEAKQEKSAKVEAQEDATFCLLPDSQSTDVESTKVARVYDSPVLADARIPKLKLPNTQEGAASDLPPESTDEETTEVTRVDDSPVLAPEIPELQLLNAEISASDCDLGGDSDDSRDHSQIIVSIDDNDR